MLRAIGRRCLIAADSAVGPPAARRAYWSWSNVLNQLEERGHIAGALEPLMKKRLHYFDSVDKDLAWLTDGERAKEVKAMIFEKLLMEEVLMQDTVKDARFWALRNAYGTQKRMQLADGSEVGKPAETRGAPDGVYMPVSQAVWDRCRHQAEFAFALLANNWRELGFRPAEAAPQAQEAGSGDAAGEAAASGGDDGAAATVGSDRADPPGAPAVTEAGVSHPAWDYEDYAEYAARFLRRMGHEREELVLRARTDVARSAVYVAANPALEVSALNHFESGAQGLFQSWSRALSAAQYREMMEGAQPFERGALRAKSGAADEGRALPRGWAVYKTLDSMDALEAELRALYEGGRAAMEQVVAGDSVAARQLATQAGPSSDDQVVEEVPGPCHRRLYAVDPRTRAVWWSYDFALGENGTQPEANAYLSDGVRAQAFAKNRFFPSVFTVQRLAQDLRVRPQRVLAAIAMQQLELQASLFGLPLDQAAHDNHVAEEEQLGHRMRHVGMGAGGAPGTLGSAERRVVRIKTFPWQSMRNLTREEYMARCRARADQEEQAMVREMGDRVKWTLGVTGQGVHRGRLTRARMQLNRPKDGKSWPLLVEMTDKHLRSESRDEDLDARMFVVQEDGHTRPLTSGERDYVLRRIPLKRRRWFKVREPEPEFKRRTA